MFLRIAVYMSLVAIVAKLLLFLLNLTQEHMAMSTMFVNLLVVLVGSYFALRSYLAKEPGAPFKEQFKAGMRSSALFALFMSIFVLVYYNYIDTHYFPMMIEERVQMAAEQQKINPDINVDQVRQMGEIMFSPKVHATITLFGLTVSGALYSLVLAILIRKFNLTRQIR